MLDETLRRSTICTITVQTKDLEPDEVFEIRRDLSFFILSVGARVLLDPLDRVSNPELIETTFEIFPRMQETVENFYHLTAMYPKHFESTISFNKIEPLTEPAIGIYID